MAPNSPSAREPVPDERPTSFAELEVRLGPAMPWGMAKGRVPPDQANYLIMTFGILGSAATGTAGAVLTLRIAPGLTGVAWAELILAFAAALIIAACGLARERDGRTRNHYPPRTDVANREGGPMGN